MFWGFFQPTVFLVSQTKDRPQSTVIIMTDFVLISLHKATFPTMPFAQAEVNKWGKK